MTLSHITHMNRAKSVKRSNTCLLCTHLCDNKLKVSCILQNNCGIHYADTLGIHYAHVVKVAPLSPLPPSPPSSSATSRSHSQTTTTCLFCSGFMHTIREIGIVFGAPIIIQTKHGHHYTPPVGSFV